MKKRLCVACVSVLGTVLAMGCGGPEQINGSIESGAQPSSTAPDEPGHEGEDTSPGSTPSEAVGDSHQGGEVQQLNTWTSYCTAHVYDPPGASSLPNKTVYCQMQGGPALEFGYTGPVDGVMGANSWKGVQLFLARYYGYTGPADGVPGQNTYKAMQRAARDEGYTGPIDGVMGPNSWKGWQILLRHRYFGV